MCLYEQKELTFLHGKFQLELRILLCQWCASLFTCWSRAPWTFRKSRKWRGLGRKWSPIFAPISRWRKTWTWWTLRLVCWWKTGSLCRLAFPSLCPRIERHRRQVEGSHCFCRLITLMLVSFWKDVVSHNKKMKTKKNKASKVDLNAGDRLGIKGLNKGKRRKLEAYQHLFYLLQVMTQWVKLSLIIPRHEARRLMRYSGVVEDRPWSCSFLSSLHFRPIHPTWPSWSSRCPKISPLSLWTLWSSPCTTTHLTRGRNTCCSNSLRQLWRRKSSKNWWLKWCSTTVTSPHSLMPLP